MEFSNLEKLEQKLNAFLAWTDKLQRENVQLNEKTSELQILLQDRDQVIQHLEEEIVQLRETQYLTKEYEEKDERIRQKINEMLHKLDQLENSISEA
ncbi:hypothetical protein BMS3Abin05_01190 [bacterium BMS3Abin05]|nr:hypothetical protein BMS3Abin05_01190 [bacterium BMS3Abin05]GBE27353.1 hypothetical protein BMS3Bbin03_01277 [bacterium BMS3Bbin03]HDL78124.1 hypothetical protein [Bacteroidota bacterium]HDZ11815.1 hypothetical protein [Bacteroidota bacterium]